MISYQQKPAQETVRAFAVWGNYIEAWMQEITRKQFIAIKGNAFT